MTMVPPIKSHFGNDIYIRRAEEAKNIIKDLSEKEDELLFDAFI